MSARVILTRGGGWSDRWRAYRIEVNAEERARLKRNSQVVLELEPGRYDIGARIDWCGSNLLTLDLAGGEEARIEVCNPHGPWRGQFVISSAPDRYLELRLVEGHEPGPGA